MAWTLDERQDLLEACAAERPSLVSVSYGPYERFLRRCARPGARSPPRSGRSRRRDARSTPGSTCSSSAVPRVAATDAARSRPCLCCSRSWTSWTSPSWSRAASADPVAWPPRWPPAPTACGSAPRSCSARRRRRRRGAGPACSRRAPTARRTRPSTTAASGSTGPPSTAAGTCGRPSATRGSRASTRSARTTTAFARDRGRPRRRGGRRAPGVRRPVGRCPGGRATRRRGGRRAGPRRRPAHRGGRSLASVGDGTAPDALSRLHPAAPGEPQTICGKPASRAIRAWSRVLAATRPDAAALSTEASGIG